MKILLLIIICITYINTTIPPIAVFHGFANGCHFKDTSTLVNRLKTDLGTHVECIVIGNGFLDSIFKNFTKLAIDACDKIKQNPNFQSDFSLFGISQGNLISRYIIEKCPIKGRVVNYLSFDGPHLGIGYIPYFTCGKVCDAINAMVSQIALKDLLVSFFAPSSYFRPRYYNKEYVKYNIFLRDLNNEGDIKNSTYKEKMTQLKKVMLIRGKKDKTICPINSSWFEFYDEEGNDIVPLEKSKFYIDDYIGIRKLNEEGKIQFVEFSGEHILYTEEEYQKYFKGFFKE